jgi:hypothetical protein
LQAGQRPDAEIDISRSNLVRTSFTVGGADVELYAAPGVEVARLVGDLDPSLAATAESLSERINAQRRSLLPDEQIILSIGPRQGARAVPGEKAGLVRAVFAWNLEFCDNCFYSAQFKSNVSVLFIDAISFGELDIFDRTGSGGWVFRDFVEEDGGFTRSTFGNRTTRGFRLETVGLETRADVIMYFFK